MTGYQSEIRKLRRAYDRKIRQKELTGKSDLARRAKVDRATVYNVFDENHTPTLDTLIRLGNELGVSINVSKLTA